MVRKGTGLALSLKKAWKELERKDPLVVSKDSGAFYSEREKVFTLSFLGEDYLISQESHEVLLKKMGKPTNPYYAAIILHYLIGARDIPLGHELVSFREFYGGDVYYDAFKRRAIDKVREFFGDEPELLLKVGKTLGAEELEKGDTAIRLQVLPKVALTVVVWKGDEEVPSSANILYEATAGHHLPTEDLAALGEILAQVLEARAKEFLS